MKFDTTKLNKLLSTDTRSPDPPVVIVCSQCGSWECSDDLTTSQCRHRVRSPAWGWGGAPPTPRSQGPRRSGSGGRRRRPAGYRAGQQTARQWTVPWSRWKPHKYSFCCYQASQLSPSPTLLTDTKRGNKMSDMEKVSYPPYFSVLF